MTSDDARGEKLIAEREKRAAVKAEREASREKVREQDRDIIRRLWQLRLQVADASDVDLPALTGPWRRLIDEYRSVQWELGNHRAADRNGKLRRDQGEPQMPERLVDADRLALAAMGIEV